LDAKDSDGGCRDHKADLTTAWKEACDAVTAADNAIKLMRSPPDEQTEKEEHAKWAKEQLRINPMTAAMFGSTFDDKGTFAPFSHLNNILVNVETLMNACNGQGGKWSLYCTD
jgi:tryptophan 2,3-dioxygenase